MQYVVVLITLVLASFYIYRINREVKGKKRWIYYEIIYNCFIKFFIGFLGLPSFLNYISDFILIILFLLEITSKRSNKKRIQRNKEFQIFVLLICFYFIVSIFSFISNQYSILQYLWGFRNNFRFLIFAILCCRIIKKKDLETIFDILFGFFGVNIIAVTYEFFFSGIRARTGDAISGLYSSGIGQGGGNGHLNWLLCIVCVYAIAKYLSKEKRAWYLFYVVAGSVYMASLSELKVFFLELAVIIIGCIGLSKKSIKIGLIGIGGVLSIILGINVIYRYFPQFADFFKMDTLIAYLGKDAGYQGVGTINRLNAISYVFSRFLHSPLERILGIGLGNADFSSFSFLQSSFYNNYSWTLYQFFYAPFVLIETGILGLISFMAIFIKYVSSAIRMKPNSKESSSYRVIAIMISIMSIAMIFYNQSLKMETSGYLVHALLVIPFVVLNDNTEDYKSYVRIKVKIKHE